MKKLAGLLVLAGVWAGWLAGCGVAPGPTEVPPTQTPWIIVVTATPEPGSIAERQSTQTPTIIAPAPTRSDKATAMPTGRVTATSKAAAEPMSTRIGSTAALPPATPTDTPAPESLKYPPPTLVDPPSGRPVGWKDTITLVWNPVGELAADEYYHVHMDRPPPTEGVEWYGDYILTKDTTLLVERSFLAPFHLAEEHGSAVVYWWVWVVRKTGVDENGKPVGVDISPPSEKRSFVVEPKPGG